VAGGVGVGGGPRLGGVVPPPPSPLQLLYTIYSAIARAVCWHRAQEEESLRYRTPRRNRGALQGLLPLLACREHGCSCG
jgi:hypothetical protein